MYFWPPEAGQSWPEVTVWLPRDEAAASAVWEPEEMDEERAGVSITVYLENILKSELGTCGYFKYLYYFLKMLIF